MENPFIFMLAVAAAVLAVLVLTWRIYNRLVRLRLNTGNSWADVDVELKRRHDLVPQLVEAVRGYMGHERELLDKVTQTRAAAGAAGLGLEARAVVELQLTGVVQQLLAKAERYPQLQAIENFRLLHEQLVSTENRVAFARQHYNEAVRQYNTALNSFPANIFGRMLGFKAAEMFASGTAERDIPAV